MNLLPIEWSIKSRSLSLLVRGGRMSGDKVCATIDNDSIKAKKKSNHSLTTCSQWQRHVQLRVFLKKKYLICIRNTLNHKIRNTFKLKKKKFELKFEKKKKNCNKAKPMASPTDYRGSKPTDSKKK